jgi:hypothetical protein
VVTVHKLGLPHGAQQGLQVGARRRRAASNALVNSMGGSFASNIATIITAGSTMRDSLEYLIRKQCPEYLGDSQGSQTAPKSELNDPKYSSYCNLNPWANECKNTNATVVRTSSKNCNKVIQKYECSYQKYLLENPSIQNWAKLNPALARKEALKLGAIDADLIEVPLAKESTMNAVPSSSIKDIEAKCLKAVDYKGCMDYNRQK